MPISGVAQPEMIYVDGDLRLRRFDGKCDLALSWYQDEETLLLVDGKADPYTPVRIKRMYDYLSERGELYWIEYRRGEDYFPIGDVTLWQDDLPIVIGDPAYRGKGIGRRVIEALCRRAGELGWQEVRVNEIYDYNEGSRRCFERAGFVPRGKTEHGTRYVRYLEDAT